MCPENIPIFIIKEPITNISMIIEKNLLPEKG